MDPASRAVARAAKHDCLATRVSAFCEHEAKHLVGTGERGNRLSRSQIIKRERLRLQSVRGTAATGSKKIDPTGVVVTADVELIGLRGKEVWLTWSMTGGPRNSDWVDDHPVYRMKATSEDDTASFDYWIPLPKSRGSYYVQSRLVLGTTTLATATNGPFR